MRLRITLGLAIFSLLGCSRTSHVRPALLVIADSIAQHGVAEGSVIGMMPFEKPSAQFQRFLSLVDTAYVDELITLSGHKSPVVRYYSLLGLSRRDSSGVLESLILHLDDTSVVKTALFDMGETSPISHYVASKFLDYYFSNAHPDNKHYSQIARIAQDTKVPSALIALSRFRNPADQYLIEMRLERAVANWHSLQARPHYALVAVREYPSPRFYRHLVHALEKELEDCYGSAAMNLALIQAIVQYPIPSSLQLIKKALVGCPKAGGKQEMMSIYVAVGLRRYPNRYFDELKPLIRLGPSGQRLVESWSHD